MLRASTLISAADDLRPLLASLSPPNSSINHRILNSPTPSVAPKSIQTPRLQALIAPRSQAWPPRSVRFFCRANHSDGAGSTIRAPADDDSKAEGEEWVGRDEVQGGRLSVGVGNPSIPVSLRMYRTSLEDKAFFLLAFIACTTSIAFTGLVIAAVPTLHAMKRAAMSLAKLADTAREELPSTMAAIRLSGMEISDLTLELSDLSQEIADGVSKSAQAVQAAEAGIRQIGAVARRQTMSMIQERASLPNISLQPVVARAAKKTSHVVGQARKTVMNLISRGEHSSDNEEQGSDKVEY